MTDMGISDLAPRRSWAMGVMILGSIGISFSGLILRFMEEADAWQIAFWRSLAVIGMISLVMLWRYRSGALAKFVAVGWPGLIGGVLMTVASLSFLQSITTTTVANTLFMLSTIPFITAILARVLLGERLRRATVITMLGAFAGVTVMIGGAVGGGQLYGNVMGFVTALGFSGYAIMVRRHRGIDMLPTLMISAAIAVVISGAVRWGDLMVPAADIGRALFIGGVLSAFANVLFIAASKHLVAAEVTLIMLLEFALGPLWVWVFIAERPTATTLVGGAIIIAAVGLRAANEIAQNRWRPPRPPVNPA